VRRDPRNVTRYWCEPGRPGLSLLWADFTTHEYAPHTHDALVVAATEVGASVIRSRGVSDYVHPPIVLVFNPAEPHAGRMGWSERWRYRSFYLAQPALHRLTGDLGLAGLPYFPRNMLADPALAGELAGLHRLLGGSGPGRPGGGLESGERLVTAFGRLFRRHGAGGGRQPAAPRDIVLTRRVVELMRDRLADDLRLADLAGPVGLTPFQLIGMFNRTVGLSPHAYLTQVRLGEACRRLRRGAGIADTAAATGFYDQSALTRHFKRSYGITPLQFARATAA
jgi:AraC-like DNA-binding protein